MHGCRRKVHWIGTRIWGDGVEYFHNRPSIPNPSPEIYSNGKTRVKGTRRISQPYPYPSYPHPYGFILGTSAADGDNVDCYLITNASLKASTIVECEPIGLLEQDEDGEVDHKVLAAMPGQDVEVGDELLQELRDFIHAVFTQFPDVCVHVGRMLPREAAL